MPGAKVRLRRKNGLYFLIDQGEEIPITREAFIQAVKDNIKVIDEPGGMQMKQRILAHKRDLICGEVSSGGITTQYTWGALAKTWLRELEAEKLHFTIEELLDQLKRLYWDILESDELVIALPEQLPDYVITIRADEAE
jgi:hypothetical protein